jgi:hypothetical protein
MNDQMASTASSCITTGTTTTTSSSIRSINELASVGTPVAPIETQSFQQEDPLVDFMEMNAETHDGTLPTVEGGAIIESASMVESITTTTTTTTLLSHSRVPRERDSSATVTTTFAASQPPLVSLSSSLHRTTMTTRTTTPTPTYFSANDPIVDAWIQQSLTMPSTNSEQQDPSSFRIDAGVMATSRHRREPSLGSGISVRTDYATIYGITMASRATFAASTTATSLNRETSQGWATISDFQKSWSSHSTPNNASSASISNSEDLWNFSSPSILSSSSALPERPLYLSRGSTSASPPPYQEDTTTQTTTVNVAGVSSVIHDAARITNWQTVIE